MERKNHKTINEHRKRFLSTALVLLASCNVIKATVMNDELIFPQLIEEETFGHYHVLIEYITHLFCIDGSYRFNHIYAERSLSTGLADILINRINKCMKGGVLISRRVNKCIQYFFHKLIYIISVKKKVYRP